MDSVPWNIVIPLLVGVAVVDGIALWDLSRHDVKQAPKWAWALVIIVVSFPIGVLLYATIGRVHPGEQPVPEYAPAPAGPPDPGTRHAGAPPPGAAAAVAAAAAPTVTPPAAPSGELILATHGLHKVYDDVAAVDGVDLAVPQGATYGLIGPNGAGKTTLLSMIAGLRRPDAGDVALTVDRSAVAVLPDTPQFDPWLTAREVVDLARALLRPDLHEDHVDAALAQAGIAHAADRRNGGFSRGMLQRLGLATCLVTDPQLLVMDEPSSALDPVGRREILDLIGELGQRKTVVLSTHILSDVQQVCDTVGVIDRGQLRFQGTMRDLLTATSASYLVHVRGDTAALVDALEALDAVTDVQPRGQGRLLVRVTDADAAERELPAAVTRLGLPLVSFNPATDLETAFLELTS